MTEPITDDYRQRMNTLAQVIDTHFNEAEQPKTVAFVLLITEFNNMKGRVNYISNGQRKDVVVMLKEVLARFEGQPEQKGNSMTGIVWTAEIIGAFRKLHADEAGYSFKEIAEKLSEQFGIKVPRNGCIGKARRLGLPLRDATPRRSVEKEKKMRVRVDAPIPPKIRPRMPGAGIDIVQLNHSNCHWPLGDFESYPPYLYCGNPAEFDRPYCRHHCNRAYNSPTKQWQ